MLGISYDSVADNKAFAEKFDFPFALLSDPDGAVAKAYGAYNPDRPEYPNRFTYVIGTDGNVSHVFTNVNPKTEAGELLELLA